MFTEKAKLLDGFSLLPNAEPKINIRADGQSPLLAKKQIDQHDSQESARKTDARVAKYN